MLASVYACIDILALGAQQLDHCLDPAGSAVIQKSVYSSSRQACLDFVCGFHLTMTAVDVVLELFAGRKPG